VNRILRISTDRWVTGRAIRWACEEARLEPLRDMRPRQFVYSFAGTSTYDRLSDEAIIVTVERNDAR
jgi:hypothetical protein